MCKRVMDLFFPNYFQLDKSHSFAFCSMQSVSATNMKLPSSYGDLPSFRLGRP